MLNVLCNELTMGRSDPLDNQNSCDKATGAKELLLKNKISICFVDHIAVLHMCTQVICF